MKLTTLAARAATILVVAYILRHALDMYESGVSPVVCLFLVFIAGISGLAVVLDILTNSED